METLNQRKREKQRGRESDGDIPEQKKVGRFHARHVSCLELGSLIFCTEGMGTCQKADVEEGHVDSVM